MYQHYCRCNIFYSPEKMIELSSRLKFMSWKFKTSPKVYNDVFWMNKVTKKGWEMSDKTLAPLGFDPRTFGLWAQHATSAPRSNLMYDNYTATYATTRTNVVHATTYVLTSCHNKINQRYIQYINQIYSRNITQRSPLPSPSL